MEIKTAQLACLKETTTLQPAFFKVRKLCWVVEDWVIVMQGKAEASEVSNMEQRAILLQVSPVLHCLYIKGKRICRTKPFTSSF